MTKPHLPQEQRDELARVVHQHGLKRTAAALELSTPALASLIAGLPVRRGTLALAQQRLPELAAALASSAAALPLPPQKHRGAPPQERRRPEKPR